MKIITNNVRGLKIFQFGEGDFDYVFAFSEAEAKDILEEELGLDQDELGDCSELTKEELDHFKYVDGGKEYTFWQCLLKRSVLFGTGGYFCGSYY
jgi:hypothetical protein